MLLFVLDKKKNNYPVLTIIHCYYLLIISINGIRLERKIVMTNMGKLIIFNKLFKLSQVLTLVLSALTLYEIFVPGCKSI